MGAVIIGALAIYGLIAIFAVIWAITFARKRGKSSLRWGLGAALVMYLIPFWDWLPTVLVHRYYCATEAGLWIYKTVNQWKAENPGVMETLVHKEIALPSASERTDADNWKLTFELNQRFHLTNKHVGPMLLHRWKTESTLIDAQTNQLIMRSMDFYTTQTRGGGGWRGWKFWLAVDHCQGHEERSARLGGILRDFKGDMR